MRIGVFTPVFADLGLEAMLDRATALGFDAVEVATGNYPGDRHCQPDRMLADMRQSAAFRAAFETRGLVISAFSCHGNPLHPDAAHAAHDDSVFRMTVRLAARLSVDRVNLFAGCPGDGPDARQPNWVTYPWPTEFSDILDWQWEERVIPYWRGAAAFASDHGVRLGIEMHPGTVVYNPRTLLRLRSAAGDSIGANLDPSHLFWQGIDPLAAIDALGPAINHVHAKDTTMDARETALNGVLDVAHSRGESDRAWRFSSVGDGHDVYFWKRFADALRAAGYDYVLSVEHEDAMRSTEAGLRRAVETLRRALS